MKIRDWFYGWFGRRYSATNRANGRPTGLHWTQLPIMRDAYATIWDLDTRTTPLRCWWTVIKKRWRYSWAVFEVGRVRRAVRLACEDGDKRKLLESRRWQHVADVWCDARRGLPIECGWVYIRRGLGALITCRDRLTITEIDDLSREYFEKSERSTFGWSREMVDREYGKDFVTAD